MNGLVALVSGPPLLVFVALVGMIALISATTTYLVGACYTSVLLYFVRLPRIGPSERKCTEPMAAEIEQLQRLAGLPDLDLGIYVDRTEADSLNAETTGFRAGIGGRSIGAPAIIVHETVFENPTLLSTVIAHEYAHHERGDPQWKVKFLAVMVFVFSFELLLTFALLWSQSPLAFLLTIVLIITFVGSCRSFMPRSRQAEYDADEAAARRLNSVTPVIELLETDNEQSGFWHEDTSTLLDEFLGGATHPSPTQRIDELRERFETTQS